uniref:ABC transporter ATP-binding protein n=1 Tax=Heterorhabditis bacteriophora TaxID=37862 RepID=A0A1I7W7A3_HETBA
MHHLHLLFHIVWLSIYSFSKMLVLWNSFSIMRILHPKFLKNGGVVLVSHDEQLIEMVCKELWVVKDRMVTNLEGGLEEYRKQVCKQLQLVA